MKLNLLILSIGLVFVLQQPGSAYGPLEKQFKDRLETPHLSVFFNHREEAREAAIFLEWWLHYINANYYRVPSKMKLKVFVFDSEVDLNDFARKVFGHKDGIRGTYSAANKAFYTSRQTGLGTFSHEMMHALFHLTNVEPDRWSDEGVPAFFEKMFGYHTKTDAYFLLGFPNPWRIERLGANLPSLSLEDTVNHPKENNTHAERLVALFLYKNGRLRTYLDLVRSGDKRGYKTYFEAAFGRSVHSLEPYWKLFIQDLYARRTRIMEIPVSKFFNNKAEFDEFMKTDGKVLKEFR